MIRRELPMFLVVGVLTVLIDFFSYTGLTRLGLAIDPAKGIGFVTGTLFAYFTNRFWTFGHKRAVPGSALRFVLLYGTTLSANVLVNSAVLGILSQSRIAVPAAFVVATGVSASLNFLGMKLFVFR